MKWWDELKEDLRRESKEIEFKRAKRRPSPPKVLLLWVIIVLNLIVAALFATTVLGIPVAMVMILGCTYLYQTYLRRS